MNYTYYIRRAPMYGHYYIIRESAVKKIMKRYLITDSQLWDSNPSQNRLKNYFNKINAK